MHKEFLMGMPLSRRRARSRWCKMWPAGYHRTPSTEVLETVAKYPDDVYVEWSVNEKVAMELGAGAAIRRSAFSRHHEAGRFKCCI